jgi:hypothetical protein
MPGSPSHEPGGNTRPKWPLDSVVCAKFSDRHRYKLSEIRDRKLPPDDITLLRMAGRLEIVVLAYGLRPRKLPTRVAKGVEMWQ